MIIFHFSLFTFHFFIVLLQGEKDMRRLKKKIFLSLFGGAVLVLGAVRWTWPGVAGDAVEEETPEVTATDTARSVSLPSVREDSVGRRKWHPVRSVPSYAKCFPDVQDVQIQAARRWGVQPVRNREEAEHYKDRLVYIAASPLYCIDDRLTHSIPYLVPRASELLSLIGRSYMDSLYVKGIPLHQVIVTSILRTEDDVARLQRRNGNATEQSCHLFGTTFDICYNRFSTVSPPGESQRRAVQNDTLKWVLSEVLRDIREQGRCYVKYEVKQGCFHITVR